MLIKNLSGYYFLSKEKYKFSDIGVYILKLIIVGTEFTQKIRAKPVKFTQKDYETMLKDIKEEVYNLVFSVFGRSLENTRLTQKNNKKRN